MEGEKKGCKGTELAANVAMSGDKTRAMGPSAFFVRVFLVRAFLVHFCRALLVLLVHFCTHARAAWRLALAHCCMPLAHNSMPAASSGTTSATNPKPNCRAPDNWVEGLGFRV
jgi:hypothetical protein